MLAHFHSNYLKISDPEKFRNFHRFLFDVQALAHFRAEVGTACNFSCWEGENHPSTSKGESYELLAKVSTLQWSQLWSSKNSRPLRELQLQPRPTGATDVSWWSSHPNMGRKSRRQNHKRRQWWIWAVVGRCCVIRKIITRIRMATQRVLLNMRGSAAASARVQEQINTARAEMLQKYPETVIRRWSLWARCKFWCCSSGNSMNWWAHSRLKRSCATLNWSRSWRMHWGCWVNRGTSENGQTRGGDGAWFDFRRRGVEKSKDRGHRSANQKIAPAFEIGAQCRLWIRK